MKTKRFGLLLAVSATMLLFGACRGKGDNPVERQAALRTIKGFYLWAVQHGKEVEALQPVIKDVPHTDRFYLDCSHLDSFAQKFLDSGFFSPEFAAAVKKYYERYKAQFEALPFCAQEYDYTPDFVERTAIKSFRMSGDRAEVVVISPYQWETNFSMVKRDGRWLISRYCVFQ